MAKEFTAHTNSITMPGFAFIDTMKKYCGLIGKIKDFEWSSWLSVVTVHFEDNPVLAGSEFRFTPYMIKKARRIE